MDFASGKARAALAFALLAGGTAFAPTGAAAGPVTASIAPFGTAADGQVVQLVTLRNARGMTVRVSARGGTIIEILAPDRTGKPANVVLGRPDFAAWEKTGGFNSVIGRYANRIAGGGFTLDGTFYKIAGANPANNVILHGGPNGFSNRLWKAATFEDASGAGARLTYVSADGENGFPGALSVTMTYTLTPDNVLRIAYDATTTKPTVLTLTNHAYFNIGGYDSGPVYDQILQVNASRWTPTDDKQVPTGEIRDVAGTPFDFRKPKPVGTAVYSTDPQILLARGLDHNFVIDKGTGPGIPVAARLFDPKSGRRLEIRTTEPGVQIYSANGFAGQLIGAGGRTLRQGDGLAFETEHFPDSPNKPNFPSTVLRPGETFHSVTEYAFSVAK
jgi:aldose 1-epimerase